jgi:hypothetical protein
VTLNVGNSAGKGDSVMTNKIVSVMMLAVTLGACSSEERQLSNARANLDTGAVKREGGERRAVNRVSVERPAVGALTKAPKAAVAITAPTACDWPSMTQEGDRAGCPDLADGKLRVVSRVDEIDPYAADERADAQIFWGSEVLLGRAATPLSVGNQIYTDFKANYTPCSSVGPTDPCGPETWDSVVRGVRSYTRSGAGINLDWERSSGWTPPKLAPSVWEPLFQPVIGKGVSSSFIYMPEGHGKISQIDRATGALIRTYAAPTPIAVPSDAQVTSPLSADAAGNVAYSVTFYRPGGEPFFPLGSWYVQARPDGTIIHRRVQDLHPYPLSSVYPFFSDSPVPDHPWPPAPGATGPIFGAYIPRPVVNSGLLPSRDGTRYYGITRMSVADRVFLVALSASDLSTIWATPLAHTMPTGCGILNPATALPGSGDELHCRVGSTLGVNQETGVIPSPYNLDIAVNAPVELPDGSIAFGGYSNHTWDGERGVTVVVGRDGTPLRSLNAGWNAIPAVRTAGGSTALVVPNSHYGQGPFYMTSWAQTTGGGSLAWNTRTTKLEQCVRSGVIETCTPVAPLSGQSPEQWNKNCTINTPTGAVSCSSVPVGDTSGNAPFDFIQRQAPVGSSGDVYATASDGAVYRLHGGTGAVKSRTFVDSAFAAADEAMAIAGDGKLIGVKEGNLYIVGN